METTALQLVTKGLWTSGVATNRFAENPTSEVTLHARGHADDNLLFNVATVDPYGHLSLEERQALGKMIAALPNLLEGALRRLQAERVRQESLKPDSKISQKNVAELCVNADRVLQEACEKALGNKLPDWESEYFNQGMENRYARIVRNTEEKTATPAA